MAAPSSTEAHAGANAPSATESGFDVFLIHKVPESEAAKQLAHALEERGLRPWLAARQGLTAARWKPDALARIGEVPACVLVLGPTGLPGEWGRREVEEAARRKLEDDDGFRFFVVYLPGAKPVAPEALPLEPDGFFTVDPDGGGADELAAALDRSATASAAGTFRPSSTVTAATSGGGERSSFALVAAVLSGHPEYGGGASPAVDLSEPPDAQIRPVEAWLDDVRALYRPAHVPTLHGRLLIDGLARLDPALEARLRAKDFLDALRREISPDVSTLLRARRETAETHTDQPASVDDLNREVIAKVLAKAIRRVRLREIDRLAHDPRPGRARGGPFLVHIYGRWGSGKTSLLHFLRKQLELDAWGTTAGDDTTGLRRALHQLYLAWWRRTPRPGDRTLVNGNWIVVEFNAWQHQRVVPPWWWLMASVSKEGSAQLRRLDAPQWVRLKLWDYRWRLKGALPGLLFLAIGLFFMWFVWAGLDTNERHTFWSSAPAAAEGLAKSLSVVLALLLTVWGGLKALSRWLLVGSPRTAGQVLKHGQDPLDALSARFEELVDRLGYPVAIFVDDLDRCSADYVVQLLEGIQTLFRDVPASYVIAADRDWLSQSFEQIYKDFCPVIGTRSPGRPLGHLFIEKTFQISVAMPELPEGVRQAYLQRLLRAPGANGAVSTADLEEARDEAQKKFQSLTSRADIVAELQRTSESSSPTEHQAAAEAAALRIGDREFEEQVEHLLQPFAPLLEPNPRSMKRLVNEFGIATAIEILRRSAASATNGAAGFTAEQLALWTILSQRWPLLADHLMDEPGDADAIRGEKPVADDAPQWLKTLWRDDEVLAVLRGNAEHVAAELTTTTISVHAGKAAPERRR